MGKVKLHVLGRVSEDTLTRFKKVFDLSKMNDAEVALFCDYSNYDVPIGYSFHVVKDVTQNILYTGNISLKKVTQEFLASYDSVPKGHKTVCLFEFLGNDIKPILRFIPSINDWYSSEGYFILE